MTINNSIILADNAYGTIAVGLAVSDTALTFTTGHGARFPAVAAGQVMYCCLLNSTNVLEEIQITAHINGSDSATIVRGVGGTSAKAWTAGDRIEVRVSSTVLKRLQDEALKKTTLTTSDAGATYTGAMDVPGLDYVTGLIYPLTLSTTNSGTAPTIALDGLSAITVKLDGGGALVAGAMPLNGLYAYDGTNFILLNPSTIDTLPIVTGSVDATKKLRIEVDGLTTATTRVWTAADVNIALGKHPTRQVFTSGSGTYTTPAGATYLRVRLIGGGGGGGGAPTNDGSAGAATTFSTFSGGAGGGGGTTGGSGGAASGGDINIPGGAGQGTGLSANAAVFPVGGQGGSGAFGGGGSGGSGNTNGVVAATNSGGGGGGGGGGAAQNSAGGGGAGGFVESFIFSPAASYSYVVGGGGSGTAGATTTGGSGATGNIVVDEYYN